MWEGRLVLALHWAPCDGPLGSGTRLLTRMLEGGEDLDQTFAVSSNQVTMIIGPDMRGGGREGGEAPREQVPTQVRAEVAGLFCLFLFLCLVLRISPRGTLLLSYIPILSIFYFETGFLLSF